MAFSMVPYVMIAAMGVKICTLQYDHFQRSECTGWRRTMPLRKLTRRVHLTHSRQAEACSPLEVLVFPALTIPVNNSLMVLREGVVWGV